jgi:hypothetical protein
MDPKKKKRVDDSGDRAKRMMHELLKPDELLPGDDILAETDEEDDEDDEEDE